MEQIKDQKRGFLNFIETAGNKLPHPATILFILSVVVVLLSYLLSIMDVGVSYDVVNNKTGKLEEMNIKVVNLLSADGIRYIFTSVIGNFVNFIALGTALVAMIGVGVADGSGLISTALRRLVLNTRKSLITSMVVFTGIMSNIAIDAGYVIFIPLGAVIFASSGRHPIAGLAAAFAGVSGGFSANLLVGPVDVMLSSITTQGARVIDKDYTVLATSNWYFMIVSTFIIVMIATWVTERIVEPRLGTYRGGLTNEDKNRLTSLNASEKRGLKFAFLFLVVGIVILALLVVPENGILRNAKTNEILNSPFMHSMVVSISLLFLLAGLGYGIGARTIKNDKDMINMMSASLATMGIFLVVVFFAAQFIALFAKSNIGILIAVKGANLLQTLDISGVILLLGFIIMTAFVNLFMGSASAKWAIMAPIFVPMLMVVGISPEMTQVAFRIGDSATNIITPLLGFFAVIVSFAQRYDDDFGIGTMVSTMLPYSFFLLIGWSVLLVVFYAFALPLGP